MPLNSGAISARISNVSFFNKYYHMWLVLGDLRASQASADALKPC